MKKILLVMIVMAFALPAITAFGANEKAADAITSTETVAPATAAVGTDTTKMTAVGSHDASNGSEMAEVEDLKNMSVDKIEKIPSNFGLWWRSVREFLTLTFTWDEMSKAEKELKFAEERMRIAKLIAEQVPDDAKAQEKAQKMIEKAQKFLDKVEAKKDKWNKDKDQGKVDQLVANIATHQSNADVIFDKLEKKLPEGNTDTFSELREKGSEASSRLLNAVANENISAETKTHLEEVKARLEQHSAEVQQYNTQRKALIEKVQNGIEGAKEDLQSLKDDRRTQLQVRTENVGEIKTRLEEQAAGGDAEAQKKLDMVNKIQGLAQENEKTQKGAQSEAATDSVAGNGNDTQTGDDKEIQAISEKIKAALEERNKASEETTAANDNKANNK